ncbi:hypothetical protein GDO81_006564 [Engystomops pustulosus]|uniref:Type I cytokine receptor cytokine-binding domain-containing protein n=1 Tax=Engystomops pustulosus TaxID=76066 RepID=A0AAV7CZJ1_ENGPU|nr:hypothetical protein GDO81_006564 [Engystomops pustulosus]KAG8589921.1 hypothetical protein GDO81_006564 [Engystomops pustulosus]
MVHSSCILSLICVWFPLATACYSGRVSKENNSVPLLQDFKVKLSPGFIQLTWHCNITKSMEELQYNVDLQSGHLEELNVSRCSFEYDIHKSIEFIVHKGLSVELQVCSGSELLYIGKQLTYMPEGKNNSAAENFACVIYNVYIMNCSWTVGKEAPEDVQYSLVLWQKKKNIDCQQYRCDSFGRQVGCVFNHPNINYGSKVYVEVRGLSNQTSVQFFDKVYWPIKDGKVILDPPSNITLTYRSDDLEIKWEKPEIQSEPDSCFMYNININNKEVM